MPRALWLFQNLNGKPASAEKSLTKHHRLLSFSDALSQTHVDASLAHACRREKRLRKTKPAQFWQRQFSKHSENIAARRSGPDKTSQFWQRKKSRLFATKTHASRSKIPAKAHSFCAAINNFISNINPRWPVFPCCPLPHLPTMPQLITDH